MTSLFHHQRSVWEEAPRWALEVRDMLSLVIQSQENTLAELQDLQAQVEANKTVVDSAIALIGGIAARITAAGTDPAALAALTTSLKAEDDALAAAVAANTPVAANTAPPVA